VLHTLVMLLGTMCYPWSELDDIVAVTGKQQRTEGDAEVEAAKVCRNDVEARGFGFFCQVQLLIVYWLRRPRDTPRVLATQWPGA